MSPAPPPYPRPVPVHGLSLRSAAVTFGMRRSCLGKAGCDVPGAGTGVGAPEWGFMAIGARPCLLFAAAAASELKSPPVSSGCSRDSVAGSGACSCSAVSPGLTREPVDAVGGGGRLGPGPESCDQSRVFFSPGLFGSGTEIPPAGKGRRRLRHISQ